MVEQDLGKEKFQQLKIYFRACEETSSAYFGRSLASGREFEEQAQMLAEHLENMGHRITSYDVVHWELQESLREEARGYDNPDRYIFENHLRELEESDIGIFEISQSSGGVGWEDCYMAYVLRRPVILLKHRAATYHSATLWGDHSPLVSKFEYDDNDYQEVLETALKWASTEARQIQTSLARPEF